MASKQGSKAKAIRSGAKSDRCRAIVGIGASAGGIESLGRLFDAMPADSGCGFVVILHLDPTHESQLASVLSRHTAMPVVDIADGMPIEPNRVHVIVPDRTPTIRAGKLRLTVPVEPRGQRHPVDDLFISLAVEKQRAIGIVLSGTGCNGTHGLLEIKSQGGMTLVQDPATAKFPGMPQSAIAAGTADHVLAPENMSVVLLRYLQHGYVAAPAGNAVAAAPDEWSALDPVFALLRLRSDQDFRGYKRATLQRRIHRRMGLTNAATLADYNKLLQTHPEEIETLVKDLMITVTGFFRDTEAWKALDEMVITPLVAARADDTELRFWVPACATGEEAYSVAMLTVERAEAARKQFQIKIFATDRLADNLRRARDGVYPEAAAASVPPSRLRRFFDKLDGSYQIKKSLRELIVFAPQNLLRDPPFSRLDLITCRNLLIYLEPEAQQRVAALFHFSLREGGYLFLGSAETIGRHGELFETLSKTWRIYRRLGPTRHDLVEFPVLGARPKAHAAENGADAGRPPPTRAAELARRVLSERYGPASVLIDRQGRALYFHGPTSEYLQPTGEPTRDLMAMVRTSLRAKLRGAVHEAIDKKHAVTFTAHVRHADTDRAVSVTVVPLSAPDHADPLLVSFETLAEKTTASAGAGTPVTQIADDGTAIIHALEDELKSTRADLENTIEQLENANEEFKSSNEEVTSINEELQSTNEELETSKEELQSFNEELHTVNSQLQHKIRELADLNSDQSNLLAGSEIATLFLDVDGRIKWFSPTCRELLNLVISDVGRPLGHFAQKFTDPNLQRDIEEVLAKLTRIEAEAQSHTGRWYLRRLLPYRTQDNRIAGVVVTFTDITDRKQAADAIDQERIYTRAIVETISQPLLILTDNLVTVSANRAFYELFKTTPAETENRLVYELGNHQWNIPDLRRLLEELLPKKQEITNFEVEHDFEAIGRRFMRLNARKLARNGDRPALILLAIDDISRSTQTTAHRDLLIREANHRVKNTLAIVQSIATQTLRQSPVIEDFTPAFEGRLHALARAHDLLTGENWQGSDIAQIVRETLEPYASTGRGRVTTEGPGVRLPPQPSVALILILHELATNAAKYGALSPGDGTLAVSWRVERDGNGENGESAKDDRHVRLRWRETGGPRVSPPTRRGFGTTLIESSAAYELHGSATMDFREDGLDCALSFPLQLSPERLH